jgi:hypothetical protein
MGSSFQGCKDIIVSLTFAVSVQIPKTIMAFIQESELPVDMADPSRDG